MLPNQPKLSLYIPDVQDSCLLSIMDVSDYPANFPVKCPELYVLVPGFREPVKFTPSDIYFKYTLNACDLGLQKEDCEYEKYNLPDGAYIIKYQIQPHDELFVEYIYYKTSNLERMYNEALCCINETRWYKHDLIRIKEFIFEIEAGMRLIKTNAEYCHDIKKAKEYYSDVLNKIRKLNCEFCGC